MGSPKRTQAENAQEVEGGRVCRQKEPSLKDISVIDIALITGRENFIVTLFNRGTAFKIDFINKH